MLFYIIRHGDPDYENDTITPYGHKEAEALAEWLDTKRLDRIFTSPLGRAKDTASYTVAHKQLTPVVLDWAEESMDYMRPFRSDSHCQFSFSTADGISDYIDFYEDDRTPTLDRMVSSADDFFSQLGYTREGALYRITNHNDEHIALFCHGGFGTALTAHLLGMPPTLGFPSMFMTTTSVTVFEFNNHPSGYTKPRLLKFADVTHLHIAGIIDDRI